MLLTFDDNHSLLRIQKGDLAPLFESTRDFVAIVSAAGRKQDIAAADTRREPTPPTPPKPKG